MRRYRYLIYTYRADSEHQNMPWDRVYLTPESDAEDIKTYSRKRHDALLFEFRKEFAHLLKIKPKQSGRVLEYEKIDLSLSATYPFERAHDGTLPRHDGDS